MSAEKKELTSEVLQKLKSSHKPQKPKTAVMLPMMVPAKRGRGRAMTRGHPVAMPANCTPRRLQRVMMQNAELKDILALSSEDLNTTAKEESAKSSAKDSCEKMELSEEKSETEICKISSEESFKSDHDYFKPLLDASVHEHVSEDVKDERTKPKFYLLGDIEEGEVLEDDVELDPRTCKKSDTRHCEEEDPGQLFDKLPSYYTALSIPRKQIRKTASCAYSRGGITVHDFIERAISPVRDDSAYSKLPDYFSSFTNSTKYDSVSDLGMSKTSSGYSSLSQSPSRRSDSRSRSLSQSPARSSSRSKSRNERSRNYRRRQSSYSSCSGYTSSSSCSSCEGSRSTSSSRSVLANALS